jgi:S-adenosylmethionine-dependent methyltransferase
LPVSVSRDPFRPPVKREIPHKPGERADPSPYGGFTSLLTRGLIPKRVFEHVAFVQNARAGDARWDSVASEFVEHYTSLYGQVRTFVLHHHLMRHLPAPPAEIVDVGGGAGHQAIRLARAGYQATIADPSRVMLDEADRLLSAEQRDVAARVRLVQIDGERAPQLLGRSRFDGVLCHGVLMYVEDPGPRVGALCALARPGGTVSVVTKNRRTLAMRPAHEGDWKRVLAAFDGDRQINGLGIDTRADDPGDLSEVLRRGGVDPVAWYGVRLFTEGWARDRPAVDEADDDVLAAELAAGQRDPYRQLSRLFHLVGKRRMG